MSDPTKVLRPAAVYVWVGVFDGDHWPYVQLRRATKDGTGATADTEIPDVVTLLKQVGFEVVEGHA